MELVKSISVGSPINSLAGIIDGRLLKVLLDKFGFTHLSPVQENVIPLFFKNKDPLVQAVTGSGKTLAYLLPLFQIVLNEIKRKRTVPGLALIILPTRELASQVYKVTLEFTSEIPELSVDLITGGRKETTITKNSSGFNSSIYIATPGKFVEALRSQDLSNVRIHRLQVLILDEADQMLSMGFESQLDYILSRCPKMRRTGLFSATQTQRVSALARSGLSNPVLVTLKVNRKEAKKKKTKSSNLELKEISEEEEEEEEEELNESIPSELENHYVILRRSEKLSFILEYITNSLPPNERKVIIFHLTCASVDYYTYLFSNFLPKSWNIFSLHGQMNNTRRTKTFENFKKSRIPSIMICTDILARGVDIQDIGLVIQHDPPTRSKEWIHRIGRSGRFGKKGNSMLLLTEGEKDYLHFLEAVLKIRISEFPKNDKNGKNEENEEIEKEEEKGEIEGEMEEQNFTDTYSGRIRELMIQDRALFEKSEDAFISFVRAYKKHESKAVFQLSKLNFSDLGVEYNVQRKIRISETKKWRWSGIKFTMSQEDIEKIKFRDTRREKARCKALNMQKHKKSIDKSGDLKKRKKDKYDFESLEGIQKLRKEKQSVKKLGRKKGMHSKSRKDVYEGLEYKAIKQEEYNYKRMRSGKISSNEYKKLSGEDEFDEMFRKKYNWIAPTEKNRSRGKKRKRRNSTRSKSKNKRRKTE